MRAVAALIPRGRDAVEAAALDVIGFADRASERLSRRGADWLRQACGDGPLRVHTHCNTGRLACLGWGTALGVIRALHDDGALRHVIVDETRPLLQGARLTCWELGQLGIEHRLACDGAAPFLISQGMADAVVVGADRIAANGDVANKIGTYSLALAAREAGIPFVVAAPESTLDPDTPTGAAIPIEQRADAEVTVPAAPAWHARAQRRVRHHAPGPGHRHRHGGTGYYPGARYHAGARAKLNWVCASANPQPR